MKSLAAAAPRILIVGDVMLDRYLWGRAERLSPEAPAPVIEIDRETQVPGGAGNVAANVHSLGGHPILLGVRGDDADGDALAGLFPDQASAVHLLVEAGRPTTSKTRILASGGRQVLRLDRETVAPIRAETEQALAALATTLLATVRVLVLSDYAKGTLNPGLLALLLQRARTLGVPVVVDPKRRDMTAYAGATVLTPNTHEATLALGLERPPRDTAQAQAAARALRRHSGAQAVLLTRGGQGMLLEEESGVLDLPAHARQVSDVTGAGDTVVAMLAVGLAEGLSLTESARRANVAAGIKVGKVGTQPVTRAEVEVERAGRALGKVLDREEARSRVRVWRERGDCVVFTNGCFDLLHAGHLHCLEAARALGQRLVVGLNGDASVRGLKGQDRPLVPQEQRALLLAGLACVDAVILYEEADPGTLVEWLGPDVLVKGDDYQPEQIAGAAFVLARGGRVVTVARLAGLSTTDLLLRLAAQPSQ